MNGIHGNRETGRATTDQVPGTEIEQRLQTVTVSSEMS